MNFSTKQTSSCPRCNHPQTPAVHSINVIGQTQCMMCPGGKCTEVAEQQVEPSMTIAGNGLALIGEMNRNDLIEEILMGQRANLADCSVEKLREFVVALRMTAVRRRLYAEAGIYDGPLGLLDF